MKGAEYDGGRVAIANVGGTLYAFDALCTHQGGPLDEGDLEGDIVTCPWHAGQFNVKTGVVESPPSGMPVKTYPVRVVNGEVLVEVP